jgi:hypothetical protein
MGAIQGKEDQRYTRSRRSSVVQTSGRAAQADTAT